MQPSQKNGSHYGEESERHVGRLEDRIHPVELGSVGVLEVHDLHDRKERQWHQGEGEHGPAPPVAAPEGGDGQDAADACGQSEQGPLRDHHQQHQAGKPDRTAKLASCRLHAPPAPRKFPTHQDRRDQGASQEKHDLVHSSRRRDDAEALGRRMKREPERRIKQPAGHADGPYPCPQPQPSSNGPNKPGLVPDCDHEHREAERDRAPWVGRGRRPVDERPDAKRRQPMRLRRAQSSGKKNGHQGKRHAQ